MVIALLYLLFLTAIFKERPMTYSELRLSEGHCFTVTAFTKIVLQMLNVRYLSFSRQLPGFLGTEDTKHVGTFLFRP